MWHVHEYAIMHVSYFKKLFNGIKSCTLQKAALLKHQLRLLNSKDLTINILKLS